MVTNTLAKERIPILLMAIFCLVSALFSGLARLGIGVPILFLNATAFHSTLMIFGFFGTVIGLERAIASRLLWAYLAPLASGISGVLMLFGYQLFASSVGFIIAGTLFATATFVIFIKQPADYTFTLLVGAALWPIGNFIMFLTENQGSIVACGISFLVLTIAGERLELTRFLRPTKYGKYLFLAITLSILVTTIFSALGRSNYDHFLGLSYCALAIWMFVFDIARRTIRKDGITRFVASCLLSGYVWLLVGGALWSDQFPDSPYQHDAAIHAITLGFIFSMVIGHAPIIFPAVMRVKIPYSWLFYLPLGALNFGLIARILGAMSENHRLLAAGGVINAISIAAFLVALVIQVIRSNQLRRC